MDTAQAAQGRGLSRMRVTRTESRSGRILEADITWQAGSPVSAGDGDGRLALLLPVYNCRPLLTRQAAALRECLDLASEVVVIDSDSTDGSAEFLSQQLRHPRLRVVSHPRGLYPSWNAGLALIRAKRVLIATAGDLMPRNNLVHLLETAEAADADVALSPPRICDADGNPDPGRDTWPIHKVLRWHPHDAPFEPAPEQLARWTMHFAGLSAGMLGSSASNLYRTRMLQRHPFPLDCGPAGDVAWGIHHLVRHKVVITPRPCADFLSHPQAPSPDDFYGWIHRQLFAHAVAACGVDINPWISRLNRYRAKEAGFQSRLRRCRQRVKSAWLLWPPAWRDKRARNLYRRRIAQLALPPDTPDPFIDFWRTHTCQPGSELPRPENAACRLHATSLPALHP